MQQRWTKYLSLASLKFILSWCDFTYHSLPSAEKNKIIHQQINNVIECLCHNTPNPKNYSQVSNGSTNQHQHTNVLNQVETSATWFSIQYNLLEVKHVEKQNISSKKQFFPTKFIRISWKIKQGKHHQWL